MIVISNLKRGIATHEQQVQAADRIEQLEADEKESVQLIDDLEIIIEKLQTDLRKYAKHTDDCRVNYRAGKRVKPCRCGYDNLFPEEKDDG